jgi:hypothetical protein
MARKMPSAYLPTDVLADSMPSSDVTFKQHHSQRTNNIYIEALV